jgi:hypothetical protein
MKRRDFFKFLGMSAAVPIVAPLLATPNPKSGISIAKPVSLSVAIKLANLPSDVVRVILNQAGIPVSAQIRKLEACNGK